ncbi:MAG: hypothetical protein Q9217_000248 [Psora testacea]
MQEEISNKEVLSHQSLRNSGCDSPIGNPMERELVGVLVQEPELEYTTLSSEYRRVIEIGVRVQKSSRPDGLVELYEGKTTSTVSLIGRSASPADSDTIASGSTSPDIAEVCPPSRILHTKTKGWGLVNRISQPIALLKGADQPRIIDLTKPNHPTKTRFKGADQPNTIDLTEPNPSTIRRYYARPSYNKTEKRFAQHTIGKVVDLTKPQAQSFLSTGSGSPWPQYSRITLASSPGLPIAQSKIERPISTRAIQSNTQRYTFGDCFCGGGGMSRGAIMAGLRVEWGFDFDHPHVKYMPETSSAPPSTIYGPMILIPTGWANHDPDTAIKRDEPAKSGGKIAPCICTNGSGTAHPSGKRDYTLRELACLQSVPLCHVFRYRGLKKRIGNMVPRVMGKAILEVVKKSLMDANGVVP